MSLYNLYGEEIRVPDYKADFSLFESFSVIGDSFATGAITADGVSDSYYNISWVSILERMTGTTSYNFSRGGLSSKTWLTDQSKGLPEMLRSPATNLYLIALGINDRNQNTPVGTISDIESDNIDSFYSYYGRIIRAVKEHSPKAIIMLTTPARFGERYDQYSTAIVRIGAYYNMAVFDLRTNAFFQSDMFSSNQESYHPLAVSYTIMAGEYKWFVENELKTNYTRYKKYTGEL